MKQRDWDKMEKKNLKEYIFNKPKFLNYVYSTTELSRRKI